MEDNEEEIEVMSEVHVGRPPHELSCLSVFTIASTPFSPIDGQHSANSAENSSLQIEHNCTSNESSESTSNNLSVDDNGDLDVLQRKKRRVHDATKNRNIITIHHHLKTKLPHVGLQIWKGALLLSDFLLYKMQTTKELDNVTALELGAGTGLAGIVMAQKAKLIFLTDHDTDILDNCYRNVFSNSHGHKIDLGSLRIRQLDWQESWPPAEFRMASPDGDLLQYSWYESDLEEVDKVSILLAADVIYSDTLTAALFCMLNKLMPPASKKVLWLALEKRYNFSVTELGVVANGYNYFRTFFKDAAKVSPELIKFEESSDQDSQQFIGRQLEVNQIPQYIREYERTIELELWEIHRK